MIYHIKNAQANIKSNFVSGTKNPHSIKIRFFETTNDHILGYGYLNEFYGGHVLIAHGGIITSLLDEAMGRSTHQIKTKPVIFTKSCTTKYIKPLLLKQSIYLLSKVVEQSGDYFTVLANLFNENKELIASATAVFKQLDIALENMNPNNYEIDTSLLFDQIELPTLKP